MPQQLASISLACVHSRLWQRMHGLACERTLWRLVADRLPGSVRLVGSPARQHLVTSRHHARPPS
jgi:hypothetical protein